jgi:hypothetical protein
MSYITFKRVLKWLFLFVAAREILGLLPFAPPVVSALFHSTTAGLLAKGAISVLGTAVVLWIVLNGARGVAEAVGNAFGAARNRWSGNGPDTARGDEGPVTDSQHAPGP